MCNRRRVKSLRSQFALVFSGTPAPVDVDAAEAEFEALAAALPHMTAMVAAEIHAKRRQRTRLV